MRDAHIIDQATRPSGFLGRIMGEVMAITNRPRNRWLLQQLDLRPGLAGLEFGFGNGEILTGFLDTVPSGQAVGIDWSQSMIDTAATRNKAALSAGRLRLQLGDITDPKLVLNEPFDRIWSSNVIQMVSDRPALFTRLRARLSENGLLAICFQPRGSKAPSPEELAPKCTVELERAGFSSVETRWMSGASPAAFCILAKP
jgi:cyclopropane fatty-acyl-phospholipid synthase-like methyltransferase